MQAKQELDSLYERIRSSFIAQDMGFDDLTVHDIARLLMRYRIQLRQLQPAALADGEKSNQELVREVKACASQAASLMNDLLLNPDVRYPLIEHYGKALKQAQEDEGIFLDLAATGSAYTGPLRRTSDDNSWRTLVRLKEELDILAKSCESFPEQVPELRNTSHLNLGLAAIQRRLVTELEQRIRVFYQALATWGERAADIQELLGLIQVQLPKQMILDVLHDSDEQ